MMSNYDIHEKLYVEARAKGWHGWGGNERIANIGQFLDALFRDKMVPKRGDVLELGCGEGVVGRLLTEKGYHVTGLDISHTAIAWAQEKAAAANLDIQYAQTDLSKPNTLPTDKYDLIVDGNCFHCIISADRKQFLQNAYRALKDGGTFFISSLCSKGQADEMIERDGKPYRWVPSVANMIAEVEQAGFVVRNHKVYGREKYDHITLHLNLANNYPINNEG
ncbi:MAG: class I SAM-dependent methyltransferase [Chloroflexi bacterium]|nr:class I SAM-dependent methyltransferase [Chloroflexota bacterium]